MAGSINLSTAYPPSRLCRSCAVGQASCQSVSGQGGFPGTRLAARFETRFKRSGKWTREVVYLLSSRTLEHLEATGLLRLKRKYWVIESRLHHWLDITMHEDLSRVRHPNAAFVLGWCGAWCSVYPTRQCAASDRPFRNPSVTPRASASSSALPAVDANASGRSSRPNILRCRT